MTLSRNLVRVVALFLAGCTCSGKPGTRPDAAPVPVVATPEVPVTTAPTPAPAADASAPITDGGPSPKDGGGPPPPGGPDPVRVAACAKMFAPLSPASFKPSDLSPEALKIGRNNSVGLRDLLACQAILSASDSACSILPDENRGDCVRLRATYSSLDLRPNETSKKWMFTEKDLAECKTLPMAEACDGFRAAAVSGDVSKCTPGDFEGFCRALFALDASMCKGSGKYQVQVEKSCIAAIETRIKLRDGLSKLINSKDAAQRAFAGAATGQKNACDPLHAKLLEDCMVRLPDSDRPVKKGGDAQKKPAK